MANDKLVLQEAAVVLMIPKDEFQICNINRDCDSGLDEVGCSPMEEGNVTEEGIIFCWGKVEGCWSRQGIGKELLKIPKGDCRRCNLIKDCDSGLDEDDCPAYVAPSFNLPLYIALWLFFYLASSSTWAGKQ